MLHFLEINKFTIIIKNIIILFFSFVSLNFFFSQTKDCSDDSISLGSNITAYAGSNLNLLDTLTGLSSPSNITYSWNLLGQATIFYISAKGTSQERIEGLKIGVNNYLPN